MKKNALLLDLDHTLCDTARADELGLGEFQLALQKHFPRNVATEIGTAYLDIIYGSKKNETEWKKRTGEGELEYRGRLLSQTLVMRNEGNLPLIDEKRWAQLFMDLRVKNLEFFPGVCVMLERLRPQFTLTVVSNGPLFSQKPKVEKLDLAEMVDHIVLGGALAHQKPHPEIFYHACSLSGCNPKDAIHVGDMLHVDIAGAFAAGIKSVWVSGGQERQGKHPVPDHVIANIIELEECLMDRI